MVPGIAVFKVDISRETGKALLLIENGCVFRPVLAWPGKKGMEDFAWSLLNICLPDDERETEPENNIN
jgi:hypothetical protein